MKDYSEKARGLWFQKAYDEIPKIVETEKVVTDRELKVRLEGEAFPGPPGCFPWVTEQALVTLVKEDALKVHGYRGRRRVGKGVPGKFYSLSGVSYSDIEQIIEDKRRVSADVNNLLTGETPASLHAEDLFLEACETKLDFVCHCRDCSEFRGLRVRRTQGKKPPDLDFILERDKIVYGTDVKNWIRYEYETRDEVIHKIKLSHQLAIVPFIIARYVDRGMARLILDAHHGILYEFKTLLFPKTMRSLAEDANRLLGYPVIATDELPRDMVETIDAIHRSFLAGKA